MVFLSGCSYRVKFDDTEDSIGNWVRNDGGWATGADDRDGAGGEEFQPRDFDEEEGGACAGDGWSVQLVETSELFRILLVGVGKSDRAGKCHLSRRICGGVVEVL